MANERVNAAGVNGLLDASSTDWWMPTIEAHTIAAHATEDVAAIAAIASSSGEAGARATPLTEAATFGHERPSRYDAVGRATARDEVLAVVAHDLRSPIHTIAAAADLLGLTSDDDRRRRQISIIQRSAQNMERLTAQLLDVARIEAGALQVRLEPIDALALIADGLEQCEGLAQERGIVVNCETSGDIPLVAGDRDRLMQVLANLLGNALKFTDPGKRVSVSAERVGEMLQISVADSGVGIADEDLPHIFTRFWQANRKSHVGAGLGLAICRGIIEAHGGRIWATSAVGRGTTVCFTLHAVPASGSSSGGPERGRAFTI